MLLEYFEEDVSVDVMQSCCGVRDMSKAGEMVDCHEDISIILKTIQYNCCSGHLSYHACHLVVFKLTSLEVTTGAFHLSMGPV